MDVSIYREDKPLNQIINPQLKRFKSQNPRTKSECCVYKGFPNHETLGKISRERREGTN